VVDFRYELDDVSMLRHLQQCKDDRPRDNVSKSRCETNCILDDARDIPPNQMYTISSEQGLHMVGGCGKLLYLSSGVAERSISVTCEAFEKL
jgi:hypothetical protein